MKIELVKNGKVPERMSTGAVGYDVYARHVGLRKEVFKDEYGEPYAEGPVTGATIKLGFKVDCSIPVIHPSMAAKMSYAAMLHPRSGWGTKYGFRLLNTTGIIDPDYRGEVMMKVVFDECPPELLAYAESECNSCDKDLCLVCPMFKGDIKVEQPRVGQMLFVPCFTGELNQVNKLNETERGEGGFGSSGA